MIKEFWQKAAWPVKAIVITIGVALFMTFTLWLESVGVITSIFK
jgi:hypothetical protein